MPTSNLHIPLYHCTPKGRIRISAGCFFVIDQGKAPWIFDIIHAAQQFKMVAAESFQPWKLSRNESGERLMSLSNEKGELIYQVSGLGEDEFPLSTLEIFYHKGCCLLKSEYCFFE